MPEGGALLTHYGGDAHSAHLAQVSAGDWVRRVAPAEITLPPSPVPVQADRDPNQAPNPQGVQKKPSIANQTLHKAALRDVEPPADLKQMCPA